MKLQWKILSASLFCLSAALAPASWAADAPAATVNGKAIPASAIDNYIRDFNLKPEQAARRDLILQDLIARELVLQDALAKKLDKRADVIAELEQLRAKLLMNAALREAMLANPITEDEMKQEYQKQLPAMQQTQYHARHVLVKTEQEAKDIIKALDKGGNFAKLAEEKSIDPSGKSNGGDLDWFGADQMVPPFSAAVAAMKKGTYSKTPVQTQFGWHVIKLEDTRTSTAPEYEAVKPQLQSFLQQRHIAAHIEKLRGAAKIEIVGQ